MPSDPTNQSGKASAPVKTTPTNLSKKEHLVWQIIQSLFFVIGLIEQTCGGGQGIHTVEHRDESQS